MLSLRHITEFLMMSTLLFIVVGQTDVLLRVVTLGVLGVCWVANYKMDMEEQQYRRL